MSPDPSIDVRFLHQQREWNLETFGPGPRTAGVVDHIRRELDEVMAAPDDVTEWADVLLLALAGAMRAGHGPGAIIRAVREKHAVNEQRTWPDWRTQDPDKAILHEQPQAEVAQPLYEFFGRATGSDPEGYYYPRWDRSQPITVTAETMPEANAKAVQVLGTHPRFGSSGFGDERDVSGWDLIWDEIVPVKDSPDGAALAAVVDVLNHIESQVNKPAGGYEAGVFEGEQNAARFIRNQMERARARSQRGRPRDGR